MFYRALMLRFVRLREGDPILNGSLEDLPFTLSAQNQPIMLMAALVR